MSRLLIAIALAACILTLPGCSWKRKSNARADILVWGFVDKKGNTVIPPRYEEVQAFSQGRSAVRIGGKWGYIDRNGRMVIRPQYQTAEPFNEGLALIQLKNKCGFIDRKGRIVIKPSFPDASSFSEGRAYVQLPREGGYIDRKGRVVIRGLEAEGCDDFAMGFAQVFKDGSYIYIDRYGRKVLVLPEELESGWFSEGVSTVTTFGFKSGYINRAGVVVIKPIFDSADNFAEGLAAVTVGSRSGYIDKSGRFVIKPQFISAGSFSNGLAAIVDNTDRFGYIDKTGHIVVRPRFIDAADFHEGLALVQDRNSWYYINKTGKKVFRSKSWPKLFEYSAASDKLWSFSEGRAAVGVLRKEGFFSYLQRIIHHRPPPPMNMGDDCG